MKKLFASLLVAALFWGCTKNNNTSNSFTVNGLHDVSMTNNVTTSVSLPITVQNESSNQETVTLSVSGLPANVSLDNSNFAASGIPTFTTVLKLVDNVATPGTYPITLTAEGSSSGTRSYNFNLTINAETDCSSQIAGHYNNSAGYTTWSSPYDYADVITSDGTVVNKIWFDNYIGMNLHTLDGKGVYGYYNCSNNTISVPYQAVYNSSGEQRNVSGSATVASAGGVTVINFTADIHGYPYSATMRQ